MKSTVVARGLWAAQLSMLCVLLLTAVGPSLGQVTSIVPTPGTVGTGGLGTVVTQSGSTTTITGGTRPGGSTGANVFHSFNTFNLGAGDTASFQNPGGALRVISRVIGGSPSNINGTIQAIGWNLYFLNPSGIIFGPSANLNVSGSAYFSTASQLRLNDGTSQRLFSTTLVALDSLLSTAPPVAFGFFGGGTPAPIVISAGSLQAGNNATLLFAGGSVQINGTRISAGRTAVGAVGAQSEVNVDPGSGNAFGASLPGGTLSAAVGTLLQANVSVETFPGSILVPGGAQVVQSTGPFGFVNRVEVTGTGGGLPPVFFPAASAVTQPVAFTGNPVDPLVFLNRAAVVMPVETPQAPATLLTSRCGARKDGEFSTFVQATRDVTPAEPGGTLASPVTLEEVGATSDVHPVNPRIVRASPRSTASASEAWQGC